MSRILIIDDNETLASGLVLMLNRMGHESVAVNSGSVGITILESKDFDLIVTDFRMNEMDGLQVLREVKERWPETDIVIMTAFGSVEIAVEAMKLGAVDFISKPFPHDAFRLKINKVIEYRQARLANTRLDEENKYLRNEIGKRYNFGEIIGRSNVITSLMESVSKVAISDSSVLLYGESGTGKELVARALHYQSERNKMPFIKVNCGALPKDLVESELFGHVKGSFTGAVSDRKGKFELAEGGTIFLDEIGDVPLEIQVKLLRVLQERQFDRVGGEQTFDVNVRIVAATNRPLRKMVDDGDFREDLYYRLEVIPLTIPPLRERAEDIPPLVDHFIEKKCSEMNLPIKKFSQRALTSLSEYSWPGNVRELENFVERSLVMVEGVEIDQHELHIENRDKKVLIENSGESLKTRMDKIERDLIQSALAENDGNKKSAAKQLGVKTTALYYKLEKYGLE
jgi:DNA-binding NtrC family response regulator